MGSPLSYGAPFPAVEAFDDMETFWSSRGAVRGAETSQFASGSPSSAQ